LAQLDAPILLEDNFAGIIFFSNKKKRAQSYYTLSQNFKKNALAFEKANAF